MSRIIGLLATAVVMGLLPACSAPSLAYNNAPELVYWWLDGYADLDDLQSVRVRDGLGQLQQWHRRNELPRLADLLQKTAQRMPDNLQPEAVCAVYAEVQASGQRLSVEAEPSVLALVTSMTSEQVNNIERKYAKTNADYREKWLAGTPAEQKDARYKQLLERAETVYGRLEAPQKDRMRQQLARASFDPQASYAQRLRHQQDAVQVLRQIVQNKPDANVARQAMRDLLARRLRAPDPAHRRYAETLVQEGCAGFAAVHNSTTPAQRATAARKLQAYADDARKLAAR